MKDLIIQLFNRKNQHRIVFDPPIEVKRTRDTLYISEIFKTHFAGSNANYQAMVERGTDPAIAVSLGLLDELSLSAILYQLKATKEKILSIQSK